MCIRDSFQDSGPLCFDSNQQRADNEYPIVFFDHELLSKPHPYAENFRALLEAHEDQGNDFIEYLNDYYENIPFWKKWLMRFMIKWMGR